MSAQLAVFSATAAEAAALFAQEDDEDDVAGAVEERGAWDATRGGGASWDVVLWCLTGRIDELGPFGTDLPTVTVLADETSYLPPAATSDLLAELQGVTDGQLQERLTRIPASVYQVGLFGQPDLRPDVIADARDLIAFTAAAVAARHGLIFALA